MEPSWISCRRSSSEHRNRTQEHAQERIWERIVATMSHKRKKAQRKGKKSHIMDDGDDGAMLDDAIGEARKLPDVQLAEL